MSRATGGELAWANRELAYRQDLLERLRVRLVAERETLVGMLSQLRPGCSRAELISSELIPLLDNINFLRERAGSILKPQKLGRKGQPIWLYGVDSVVYREPLGRVLILGPGNYPLFLPMVQAFYAWIAGNSVWLQSAPGSFALHDRVRDLFLSVGGPPEAFRLLGEEISSYGWALSQGVDKVILVGSAETGETVLAQAGRALVPSVAELSGWDAVFVHPQANLETVASAVAFGLSLNGGRTCVAPRRVLFQGDLESFEQHLEEALRMRPQVALSSAERVLVDRAKSLGAKVVGGSQGPLLLSRVHRDHPLLKEPNFGALAVVHSVSDDDEALEVARSCGYALGASLFGPLDWAEGMAHRVPGQMISVNDIIVPSVDPRLPFGGRGRSGYGHMRGREGVLEMTATRVVSVRRGGTTDHLRPPTPIDDPLIERFLLMAHGPGWLSKTRACLEMVMLIARERIRRRLAARRSFQSLKSGKNNTSDQTGGTP